jgi:hypothetical protein
MKKYIYQFFILVIILFISGCTTSNEQQLYILMNEYISTNGERLLEYVEKDTSLARKG